MLISVQLSKYSVNDIQNFEKDSTKKVIKSVSQIRSPYRNKEQNVILCKCN